MIARVYRHLVSTMTKAKTLEERATAYAKLNEKTVRLRRSSSSGYKAGWLACARETMAELRVTVEKEFTRGRTG